MNIVGVTNNTALPYIDDVPEQLIEDCAVSNSGLYMDSLPGGIDLTMLDDAQSLEVALNLGLKAAKQASQMLYSELVVAIANRYKAGKPRFNGDIGRRTVSANLTSQARIQGHRYSVDTPIAGEIEITRIAIQLNGSNPDGKIYIGRSEYGEKAMLEVLHELPVTATVGQWASATLPDGGIKLPMQIDGVAQDYYIYWDRNDFPGLLAKNNDIKCGTCGSNNNINALSNYMHYSGFATSSTDKLNNISTDSKGHGISVTAVVGCNTTNVICREYEKKEAVKTVMDRAALYKAGMLWIEYINQSGFLNRFTMMNREYLWGKRNHFEAEFNKRVTVILDNMTLGETGCYECGDKKIIKGTIYG